MERKDIIEIALEEYQRKMIIKGIKATLEGREEEEEEIEKEAETVIRIIEKVIREGRIKAIERINEVLIDEMEKIKSAEGKDFLETIMNENYRELIELHKEEEK